MNFLDTLYIQQPEIWPEIHGSIAAKQVHEYGIWS